jgi:diguanylate cyclase (GGDEF)-like protein
MLDGAPVRVRIAEPGTATPRLFDVRATVLRARSGVDGWVLVLRDITEQQRVEDRLASLAHYDHLTGLPNRLLFYDRLAVMLARGRRYDTQTVVLFIDLDGFKEANDTYGHAVGDRLLQLVADRLRQCMREADTVARLGGDEFLVVAPDVQQADGAIGAARRVFEAFASSFVVEAHIIAIKASVGVAVSPRDGSTAEELVHNADRAMYEAKAQGKNTWRLHGRAGQLIADYVVMEGQGAKRRN